MSILLVSIGFICCLVGIVGSFLPVMPGLPISWLGILILYFVPEIGLSSQLLWITLGVTLLIFALEYLIPLFGIKKFGGSKYGVYGAGIGLVVGLFTPIPLSALIFPFLGAYISELTLSKMESKQALRAALGSFIGFLASTFIEVLAAIIFTCIYTYQVIQFRTLLF